MLPRHSHVAIKRPFQSTHSSYSQPSSQQQERSFLREAAAEFIRGTSRGWGRQELASWLLCHYAPCLAADSAVHPDGRPGSSGGFERGFGAAVPPALIAQTPTRPRLDEDHVEHLVLHARRKTLVILTDLTWPSQAKTITQTAIAAGAVIKQRDPSGMLVWAPVGRARMRLADRVASLFIADYLASPSDYQHVALCRYCGELGFSGPIPHEPNCDRRAA